MAVNTLSQAFVRVPVSRSSLWLAPLLPSFLVSDDNLIKKMPCKSYAFGFSGCMRSNSIYTLLRKKLLHMLWTREDASSIISSDGLILHILPDAVMDLARMQRSILWGVSSLQKDIFSFLDYLLRKSKKSWKSHFFSFWGFITTWSLTAAAYQLGYSLCQNKLLAWNKMCLLSHQSTEAFEQMPEGDLSRNYTLVSFLCFTVHKGRKPSASVKNLEQQGHWNELILQKRSSVRSRK